MASLARVLRSVWTSLTLELENEGSVARDHLASERTFLAWLRTSLSLVSIGIAITQIFQIPSLIGRKSLEHALALAASSGYLYTQDADSASIATYRIYQLDRLEDLTRLGKPIGGGFIALGILVLLLGCRRYFVVQAHLVKGTFPPSRASIALTAFLVGALIVAAFAVIFVGPTKTGDL